MLNWLGERSTYHKTTVRRVTTYLKRKCGEADFERKLVADRITDAYGYDAKTKTWYLCEIKVNWNDLQKALYQIHDTAYRFKQAHKKDNVVPVIAFPARLQKELVKLDNWGSFCDSCKNNGTAIWIVEQSTVREVQRPRTSVKKAKSTKKTSTIAQKTTSKSKGNMVAKAKLSKKSAAKSTKTKAVKVASAKTAKAKITKSKSLKTRTSRTKK